MFPSNLYRQFMCLCRFINMCSSTAFTTKPWRNTRIDSSIKPTNQINATRFKHLSFKFVDWSQVEMNRILKWCHYRAMARNKLHSYYIMSLSYCTLFLITTSRVQQIIIHVVMFMFLLNLNGIHRTIHVTTYEPSIHVY